MAQLLSETASSVAEAASAVASSEDTPLNYSFMSTGSTAGPPIFNSVWLLPSRRSLRFPVKTKARKSLTRKTPSGASGTTTRSAPSQDRNFLGTKEMTQTAFLKLCNINSNSYYRFMNLKGPYGGCDNQTYEGAAIFFYRREKKEKADKAKLKALKPQARKRKATEEKEQKTKKLKTGDELLKKIQDVELPDMDEDGSVAVFDDCDEIRKKINFFLGEKIVTKAAFLRALGDINSNSLRSFMNSKRGAGSGAANVVYRTAYIFFEKKRILEGGKKTKKRLDSEKTQDRHGFPLRHDNGMRWVIVPNRM
ncbi:hypothetical protein PC118_g11139 [Phytophthora cactorum]|uniref:DUF7726 domain-containing protein n=1 Tax=Phytophthora cactorum TaxID=29920 RepID=A0A8T1FZK4_9STRA|nr:hypothetical protein PC111_g10003 [Phytophthora cactorum]KAG2980498.1 hypothetical protein PC118_g11139 [Phytophthora cactorum]